MQDWGREPAGMVPDSNAATLAAVNEQRAAIGEQGGGRVFLFLYTDDFWRDYEAYRSKGVVFVREPREEVYGMVAVFEDLYGNRWDLLQPTHGSRSWTAATA